MQKREPGLSDGERGIADPDHFINKRAGSIIGQARWAISDDSGPEIIAGLSRFRA
jgi:hypothetical protein